MKIKSFLSFIVFFFVMPEAFSYESSKIEIRAIIKEQNLVLPHGDLVWGDFFYFYTTLSDQDLKKIREQAFTLNIENKINLTREELVNEMRKIKDFNKYVFIYEAPELVSFVKQPFRYDQYIKNLVQEKMRTHCVDCIIEKVYFGYSPLFKTRPEQVMWSDLNSNKIKIFSNLSENQIHVGEIFVKAPLYQIQSFVPKSESISQAKVVSIEKEIKLSQLNQYYRDGTFQSVEAIRPLSAGHWLLVRDLKKIILIKNGQTVRGLVRNNNFEIEMRLIAKNSGSLNDIIQVEYNKKKLNARVLSEQEVEILE